MSDRPSPPWYLALDVWMALGHDSRGFDPYVERHDRNWADVWANLLTAVRGPQAPCAAPIADWTDDRCVLSDGHFGPHYGAGDVGSPQEIPWRSADTDAPKAAEGLAEGLLRQLLAAKVISFHGLLAYDGSDGYRESPITAEQAALLRRLKDPPDVGDGHT